jgi:hypothetical protein
MIGSKGKSSLKEELVIERTNLKLKRLMHKTHLHQSHQARKKVEKGAKVNQKTKRKNEFIIIILKQLKEYI